MIYIAPEIIENKKCVFFPFLLIFCVGLHFPATYGHWELFYTKYDMLDQKHKFFSYPCVIQLIEQRDPFRYSSIQELEYAITANNISFTPIKRRFDSDIIYILGRMLNKVCVILLLYAEVFWMMCRIKLDVLRC
jgi:hypothetical protein